MQAAGSVLEKGSPQPPPQRAARKCVDVRQGEEGRPETADACMKFLLRRLQVNLEVPISGGGGLRPIFGGTVHK